MSDVDNYNLLKAGLYNFGEALSSILDVSLENTTQDDIKRNYDTLLDTGNSIIKNGSANVELKSEDDILSGNQIYLRANYLTEFRYDELLEGISGLKKSLDILKEYRVNHLSNLLTYLSDDIARESFDDTDFKMISNITSVIDSVTCELSDIVVYANDLLKEIPDNYLQEVLGQLAIADSGSDIDFSESEIYFRDAVNKLSELQLESLHEINAPIIIADYGSRPIMDGHRNLIKRVVDLRSEPGGDTEKKELIQSYELLPYVGGGSIPLTKLGKNAARFLKEKMKYDR